jgi:hypothetical protein
VSACPEYALRLVEMARGTADAEAERHAASCVGCAGRLEEERALSRELAALAAADAFREAPPELEGVLRARLRPARPASGGAAHHPRRTSLAWLAAAAVLLLGLTLAFLRSTPEPGVAPAGSTARRDAEPVMEFTPLVYGEPLDGAEALHLARVSVPRSALPSLGWGEMEDGPPLTAEVLVGQDGLARGIRFVQGEEK